MERVKYDEATKRVYINKKQYFEGVAPEVWKYCIGAYQGLKKYLKDRRKRKLSLSEIDYYKKMAWAIEITREIQEKIDKIHIGVL